MLIAERNAQKEIVRAESAVSHLQLLRGQRSDGVGEVGDAQVAVGVVIRGRERLLPRALKITE